MKLKQTINTYEAHGLEIMSAVAPWLAPIPSAYFVGVAVYHQLDTHILIGIISAVAVEAVGIVSITNALRLYEWNQEKRKSDPHAPIWLALTAVFVYFAVTILLTVLLESFPQLSHIAPAIFPILAAVGAVNIAVRNSQNTRETNRRAGKQANVKRTTVAHTTATLTPAVTTLPTAAQSSDTVPAATLGHFKVLHGIAGEFTTAQARDALELSPKGAGNVLRAAVERGILDKKGRGIYAANGTHPDTIKVNGETS